MPLFRRRIKNPILDPLIHDVEMNLSNNYKDEAQKSLRALENAFRAETDARHLRDSEREHYAEILKEYQEKMDHFTHADQKPYWTK